MLPLGLLTAGEKAVVVKTHLPQAVQFEQAEGVKNSKSARVEEIGLRAGKLIQVLNNKGRSPLVVKVDNSRIAVARAMAMKIMVKKEEK